MLSAEASSAICVQRFDGSRNSAIHTTYRISLRSSSLREPRYPLLRVVFGLKEPARPGCHKLQLQMVWVRSVVWSAVEPDRERPASPLPAGGRVAPRQTLAQAFPDRRSRPAAGPGPSARAVPREGPQPREQQVGSRVWISIDSMILPQVHLRKPCYDFSFL